MGIYIGTSGYFFPDWSKTFYPKGLSQRLWLRYYVMHFPALELNSTFYAIPPQERIEKLVSQLPDDFVLTVKVPRSITHEESSKKELSNYILELENAIAPAKDKQVFKGFLAQFPVSFRFSRKNFEKLKAIVEALTRPLFVEFRNSSWRNTRRENTGGRLERASTTGARAAHQYRQVSETSSTQSHCSARS